MSFYDRYLHYVLLNDNIGFIDYSVGNNVVMESATNCRVSNESAKLPIEMHQDS